MMPGEILKEKLKEKLIENEGLGPHTSMQIGGVADYYFEAETVDELQQAMEAAVEAEVPYFLLGGGSNVIVSDIGYPGLVIANKTSGLNFLLDKAQAIVDSGVFLAHLVTKSAERELGGIEFLIGVPGTVGGAVYGNASCWGGVFGDYVRSVTLLIPPKEKGEKVEIMNVGVEKLGMGYHTSWMKELGKKDDGRAPIILTVLVQLVRLRREEIMRRISEYQQLRMDKQPVGELSVGCVFKNPIGMATRAGDDNKDNLSAGYLIDSAGGKKIKIGGARVSKKHANFVINSGKATSKDVKDVIENIKCAVMDKHGIKLEEEVEFLGKWDEGEKELGGN